MHSFIHDTLYMQTGGNSSCGHIPPVPASAKLKKKILKVELCLVNTSSSEQKSSSVSIKCKPEEPIRVEQLSKLMKDIDHLGRIIPTD